VWGERLYFSHPVKTGLVWKPWRGPYWPEIARVATAAKKATSHIDVGRDPTTTRIVSTQTSDGRERGGIILSQQLPCKSKGKGICSGPLIGRGALLCRAGPNPAMILKSGKLHGRGEGKKT